MSRKSILNHIGASKKLTLLVLVILLPLWVLQTTSIYRSYRQQMHQELLNTRALAEATRTAFMNYINSIWNTEYAIGTALEQRVIPTEQIPTYLNRQRRNIHTIKEVYWLDPKGIILESTLPIAKGTSLSDRPYVKRIVNGADTVISDIVISKVTSQVMLPIARSIRIDGVLRGIVLISVNLEKLSTVLPKPKGQSNVGLVDTQGRIAFHSALPHLTWGQRQLKTDSLIRRALRGESIVIPEIKYTVDGKSRMGASLPINVIGWAVNSSTPTDTITSIYKKNAIRDTTILLIVSTIALGLAHAISNGFIQRLKELANTANKVGSGDLLTRVEIDGSDEIARTGEDINLMIEDLSTLSKAKDEFLAVCSHELKTPLTVVAANIQLLIEKYNQIDNSTQLGQLKKVLAQTWKLNRLVSDILDVSRLERGSLNISPKIINTSQLVKSVVENFRQGCTTHQINLIELHECSILADTERIEQAIINLLSNAVRYSHPGSSIVVNVLCTKDKVEISVSDEGQGISREDIPHLFDRYYRTQDGQLAVKEGLGLGLYLTSQIIRLHNGEIHVQSELGKGSTFILELPVIDSTVIQSMCC